MCILKGKIENKLKYFRKSIIFITFYNRRVSYLFVQLFWNGEIQLSLSLYYKGQRESSTTGLEELAKEMGDGEKPWT